MPKDNLGAHELIQKTLTRIDPTRVAAVSKISANCPPKRLKIYLRSITGESTSRAAIKAMCQHCFGWEDLDQPCTSYGCPLYAIKEGIRPKRVKRIFTEGTV